MNTGIIASRYAKALLKLVDETGSGEVVVSQAHAVLEALAAVPELRRLLVDLSVSDDKKLSLLETAGKVDPSVNSLDPSCHPERSEGSLSPELRRFFALLLRNGRIGDISLVLRSFEDQYYKARNIIRGHLILSSEPDEYAKALEDKLKSLIEDKTGKTLRLVTQVDESLIGGFTLEIGDKLLDASVSHQLDVIKRQFVERNRRIV